MEEPLMSSEEIQRNFQKFTISCVAETTAISKSMQCGQYQEPSAKMYWRLWSLSPCVLRLLATLLVSQGQLQNLLNLGVKWSGRLTLLASPRAICCSVCNVPFAPDQAYFPRLCGSLSSQLLQYKPLHPVVIWQWGSVLESYAAVSQICIVLTAVSPVISFVCLVTWFKASSWVWLQTAYSV